MRILWSPKAKADVRRLYLFLAQHDLHAADALFDGLLVAPESLLDFPRRGPRLSQFDPREVREFRVGAYLLRYELAAGDIHVLRFFHAREDRFG
jgi:plasmid stabilization system protein ParE